jgi:hypothetical protein
MCGIYLHFTLRLSDAEETIFGNINRQITSQNFALPMNTAVGPSNLAILSDPSKRAQNRDSWKD